MYGVSLYIDITLCSQLTLNNICRCQFEVDAILGHVKLDLYIVRRLGFEWSLKVQCPT